MRVVVAFALLLSACAPQVVGANERGIVLTDIDGFNDARAFALADKHCKQFGRTARLNSYDRWSWHAAYDCIQ